MNNLVDKINTAIRWSFYIIFFFVPLVIWPDTFELFEFNKMWLVFGFALLVFFLWGSKMILERKFEIRRTPLDIPLALFFISQLISTFISMEPHVSFWGYYSRFNGGLLSTIAYIFLYYAFATNFAGSDERPPISYKLLVVSLLSGLAVTLWGLPSHFGYDFTCLFFRGSFDVSCWTSQFQPMVRMFSTLGQPNWFGTFLAALSPIAIGFTVYNAKQHPKKLVKPALYSILTGLFLAGTVFSNSQSSYLALLVGLAVFFVIFIYLEFLREKVNVSEKLKEKGIRFAGLSIIIFVLVTFFLGSPITLINNLSFPQLKNVLIKQSAPAAAPATAKPQDTSESFTTNPNIEIGGSASSKIRLNVWKGAIELFRQHPLFGTGVETFAYAYYSVKPLSHNLTSEWDYLYNKAHNEYLNYLATTGAFGLGSYLLIIAFVFYYSVKRIIFVKPEDKFSPISSGIIGGYSAILVSNFFGFSVVPINLLFFILPILLFDIEKEKMPLFSIPKNSSESDKPSPLKLTAILILGLICLYYEFYLLNFWSADRKYALGYNLDKTGEYAQGYQNLSDAVRMLPSEDLYKDEFSVNMATLSLLLAQNNKTDEARQMGQAAKTLSDQIIAAHPNNIVYYKTRIRVLYALSQLDPSFLDAAIDAAKYATTLAPTDAKLTYNIALFYTEKNDTDNTVKYLDKTLQLKPNYIDPRFAKAQLFVNLAKKNPARAAEFKKVARTQVLYILENVDPTHKASKDLLKTL